MSSEDIKQYITNELINVKNILESANSKQKEELNIDLDVIKNTSKHIMKLIRKHLSNQGYRSWYEFRVNALTTAYYALSDYIDKDNQKGITKALETIDELIAPAAL